MIWPVTFYNQFGDVTRHIKLDVQSISLDAERRTVGVVSIDGKTFPVRYDNNFGTWSYREPFNHWPNRK